MHRPFWSTEVSIPYDVRGTVTLTSRKKGVFVADVDRSAHGIHYLRPYPSEDWIWGCI